MWWVVGGGERGWGCRGRKGGEPVRKRRSRGVGEGERTGLSGRDEGVGYRGRNGMG